MKKGLLALMLSLAVGYSGYLLTMAVPAAARSTAYAAHLNHLGALAEAGTQRLVGGGSPQPLLEACREQPRVDRLQLLAYFGVPASGVLAALGDQAAGFPSRKIFAVKPAGGPPPDHAEEIKHATLPSHGRSIATFFKELLISPPDEWGRRVNVWNEPFNQPLDEVRYLVVHQLQSLRAPALIEGTRYQVGSMSFRSALLDARTGEQLCQGLTVLDQDGKVQVRGEGDTEAVAQKNLDAAKERALRSAFVGSTYAFALGSVCVLGGSALCQTTGQAFDESP